MPEIRPVAASYPAPETLSKPPLGLKVNTHGPDGVTAVMVGSLLLIEASHVFAVACLVKVAEMTCALPSESYTLTGTANLLPTAAEASRFRLMLNPAVAFAARLVPTGTTIS